MVKKSSFVGPTPEGATPSQVTTFRTTGITPDPAFSKVGFRPSGGGRRDISSQISDQQLAAQSEASARQAETQRLAKIKKEETARQQSRVREQQRQTRIRAGTIAGQVTQAETSRQQSLQRDIRSFTPTEVSRRQSLISAPTPTQRRTLPFPESIFGATKERVVSERAKAIELQNITRQASLISKEFQADPQRFVDRPGVVGLSTPTGEEITLTPQFFEQAIDTRGVRASSILTAQREFESKAPLEKVIRRGSSLSTEIFSLARGGAEFGLSALGSLGIQKIERGQSFDPLGFPDIKLEGDVPILGRVEPSPRQPISVGFLEDPRQFISEAGTSPRTGLDVAGAATLIGVGARALITAPRSVFSARTLEPFSPIRPKGGLFVPEVGGEDIFLTQAVVKRGRGTVATARGGTPSGDLRVTVIEATRPTKAGREITQQRIQFEQPGLSIEPGRVRQARVISTFEGVGGTGAKGIGKIVETGKGFRLERTLEGFQTGGGKALIRPVSRTILFEGERARRGGQVISGQFELFEGGTRGFNIGAIASPEISRGISFFAGGRSRRTLTRRGIVERVDPQVFGTRIDVSRRTGFEFDAGGVSEFSIGTGGGRQRTSLQQTFGGGDITSALPELAKTIRPVGGIKAPRIAPVKLTAPQTTTTTQAPSVSIVSQRQDTFAIQSQPSSLGSGFSLLSLPGVLSAQRGGQGLISIPSLGSSSISRSRQPLVSISATLQETSQIQQQRLRLSAPLSAPTTPGFPSSFGFSPFFPPPIIPFPSLGGAPTRRRRRRRRPQTRVQTRASLTGIVFGFEGLPTEVGDLGVVPGQIRGVPVRKKQKKKIIKKKKKKKSS